MGQLLINILLMVIHVKSVERHMGSQLFSSWRTCFIVKGLELKYIIEYLFNNKHRHYLKLKLQTIILNSNYAIHPPFSSKIILILNKNRFNATRLLERLRDKRMAFVGDSLNRNQWISMICLLGATIPDPSKTMETNGFRMSFRVKVF